MSKKYTPRDDTKRKEASKRVGRASHERWVKRDDRSGELLRQSSKRFSEAMKRLAQR